MQRLDTKTLPAFLASPGLAVMLISTEDTPLDAHANDFARLWVACVECGRDDIRFGYVDIENTPAARTLAGSPALPLILLLSDGQIVCRSLNKVLHDVALYPGCNRAQWHKPDMSMAA